MYTVKIKESSTELTPKERIMYKDTTIAVKIDEEVDTASYVDITPTGYVVLDIHNDKAKDKQDYTKYIIVDADGKRYTTGSPSFWESFMDIWSELGDTGDYVIRCYKRDSKNYQGKQFLTCSLIG